METLLAVMLILCGCGVTATAVWQALRRRRRADALAQYAHGRHMRFAAEDPLDLPKRYRRFALMQGGHDLHAENLCDGRRGAGRTRTFDLKLAVAGARRRQDRQYAVAVVELADGIKLPDPARGDRPEGPGIEVIGRAVMAHVPMGDAPLDHDKALDRVLGALARPGDSDGE